MHVRLRHALTLSVSALALLCTPILFNDAGLPFVPDIAAHAGNGNGNGGDNGNGGGNGGGNGNSGGGNGGSGDSGNGGGNGNSGGGGDNAGVSQGSSGNSGGKSGSRGKKSAVDSDISETAELDGGPVAKQRSLNAELGGLNSLKRNINGLMNSSDPRMDDIRAFIVASANLEEATEKRDDANAALAKAEEAYLDALKAAKISPPLGVTPETIETRIGDIEDLLEDPETPEDDLEGLAEELAILQKALAPVAAAYADLSDARSDADDAEDAVKELEAKTDAAALEDALRSAANRNRAVTDDVVAWASAQLGVGDSNGLIDDYIAKQN